MLVMRWLSIWAGYWLLIPSVSAISLILAFLVARINFRLKVLWVGCRPYLSTRTLAWLQEMDTSLFHIPPQLEVLDLDTTMLEFL